ncbi:small-subunit processome [Filobasidium floriforme]|uniref:small-subunit processome n=1 Tax=Filobasidium floriforme TaxID=5210 RepID=UPI001E8D05E6|nr:small-subunit processome [Filobasidium floriforme]KAH8080205.1 small-subunit processome [Filobasidium floriforme]
MAGSSIRNSVHRRNHKERAQPLARAKLGLLEKKKDYVLRARDYKSKKERLKRLREKAAFRNKDEFYWGMIKAKTQGGVHVQERSSSNTLGVDEVKLLKSQDAGYVRLAIAKDESKITALKTQLQVLTSLFPSLPSASNSDPDSWSDMDEGSADEDADELEDVDMETLEEAGLVARSKKVNVKGKGKETGQVGRGHTVFTDDKDELLEWEPTARASKPTQTESSRSESVEEVDLGWVTTNRRAPQPQSKSKSRAEEPSAIESDEDEDDDDDVNEMGEIEVDVKRAEQKRVEKDLRREANQHRHLLLLELQQRLKRLTQLRSVLTQIELQKQMMGKGGVIKKKDAERIVLPSLRKGRMAREGKRDDNGDDDDADGRVVHHGKVMKWKAERKR